MSHHASEQHHHTKKPNKLIISFSLSEQNVNEMFVLIYVCYYGERMLKPGKWPNEMEIMSCENFICHDIAGRKKKKKKNKLLVLVHLDFLLLGCIENKLTVIAVAVLCLNRSILQEHGFVLSSRIAELMYSDGYSWRSLQVFLLATMKK